MWRMCALQCVCVCVCAVIHLLQLVYSTVSRERRRLPWSFLSQMLLRNRWVFFINGWRIAALLATQHTGQPKLCESDNSVTSACCVQAKLFTVCGNGPQQKSHRQAAIGENEMTTERMKNAARDIFQHISSLFFFFSPCGNMPGRNGKSGEQTKKMHLSQLSFILSESYRIWPSAYPLLCPES